MLQLINNIFRLLQLFQWCHIRQRYKIKPPFPGRHFTFPITFDSSVPFKVQDILDLHLSDSPLNYHVLMFSLYTTKLPHMNSALTISERTSRHYTPVSDQHLHQITLPTLTDTNNVSLHCY